MKEDDPPVVAVLLHPSSSPGPPYAILRRSESFPNFAIAPAAAAWRGERWKKPRGGGAGSEGRGGAAKRRGRSRRSERAPHPVWHQGPGTM